MKPVVDIIMPAKNRARYIGEAIESILAQSYQNFRLIIVDNGSRDQTMAIAKNYTDPRIEVFDGPNMNLPEVLNFAISKGNAPYIVRMDSDDYSYPERIEFLLRKMESGDDLCVVSGSLNVCGPNLEHYSTIEAELKPQVIKRKLIVKNTIMNPACMINRSAFEVVGGYNPKFNIAEDYELFLRLATQGNFANIPDILIKYRKHSGSSVINRKKLTIYTAFARFNAIARELRKPELEVNVDDAGHKSLSEFVEASSEWKMRSMLRRSILVTARKLKKHSVIA